MSGDDVICNSSSNPHVREVLERRLTRRDLLRGGLSATALSFAGGGSAAKYSSHWPDGGMARPRSATIVITRNDGGVIGL